MQIVDGLLDAREDLAHRAERERYDGELLDILHACKAAIKAVVRIPW